ncbi:hypothetical protein X736_32965 [Mesorhizobium sp. L2C089B000]|nr:hypothetical protein X736_32965 [Mesorhizobium sp. L2C089B000]
MVSQMSTYHSGSAYSRKDQVGDPDDGQPDVDIPFGFRIFAALGDAEQITGRGHDNEELVAPEHEPGEIATEQPSAACALDDIERRAKQRVAAEGKDDARGVQRPQAAEVEPGLYVEIGIGKLQRDYHADKHADDTPEHGGDGAIADWTIHVGGRVDRSGRLELSVTQ